MRVSAAVAIALLVAGSAFGAVKIESPATISIPVTGDKEPVTLTVYYTPKDAVQKAAVTGVGPLKTPDNITVSPPVPGDVTGSVVITVTPKGLVKPGDNHSGTLIFQTAAGTESVPITVTRAKGSFAASALQNDVCLSCGEPQELAIQITNSGSVPLNRVRVGTVVMSDAARHHRWLPVSSGVLKGVQPGETRTLVMSLGSPQYAGDYATSVEVLAPDAATAQTTAIVRVRGPYGGTALPPILFLVVVTIGAVIAHRLEGYFGSGEGAVRDKALISLQAAQRRLVEFEQWAKTWEGAHTASNQKLTWTRERISAGLREIDDALENAAAKKAETLTALAAAAATQLEKRGILKQKVEFATGNDLIAKVSDLDRQDDADADYEKKLNDILQAPPPQRLAEGSSFPERVRQIGNEVKLRFDRMDGLRRAVLIFVSIATAYLTLYYNKCSYGSAADYITSFFWGLGLTAAGNAIIAEGTSKYSRPTG